MIRSYMWEQKHNLTHNPGIEPNDSQGKGETGQATPQQK